MPINRDRTTQFTVNLEIGAKEKFTEAVKKQKYPIPPSALARLLMEWWTYWTLKGETPDITTHLEDQLQSQSPDRTNDIVSVADITNMLQ